MQGGQRRYFVVLRMALGIVCVAVVGVIAAPTAFASSPAGDQYGSALPGGGNGGGASGSSSSGGSGTTIPVAPDSSSSSQTATGGSTDSSATKATDTGSKANGGSSHDGRKADASKAHEAGAASGGPGSVNVSNAGHSVPRIATDSAGDSWLPFFIGGLVALACAAAALVFFRNRRRTAQG
jgi:hypothetical protein